jgi:hypothetical protein
LAIGEGEKLFDERPIFAFRRRLEAFGGDPREEGLSGGRDG